MYSLPALIALVLLSVGVEAAWTGDSRLSSSKKSSSSPPCPPPTPIPRRTATRQAASSRRREVFAFATTGLIGTLIVPAEPALAYTPDPDTLRESLYLMSRVQEATVLQERFATNGKLQQDMKKKMKLSLRLVDKSYRILDQINYASQFVEPKDALVTATEAGYEAADSLQSAIDFVNKDLNEGPVTDEQRAFLQAAMQTTRNELFVFLEYMPTGKLAEARLRVEKENVDNRDEFAGADDAGVYNPVKLPWK